MHQPDLLRTLNNAGWVIRADTRKLFKICSIYSGHGRVDIILTIPAQGRRVSTPGAPPSSRPPTCVSDVRDLVPDSRERAKPTLTSQGNLDPNTGDLFKGRVPKAMLSIDFSSLSTARLSVGPDAEASNQIEGTSRAPFLYRECPRNKRLYET
jgi:hypothetical protein